MSKKTGRETGSDKAAAKAQLQNVTPEEMKRALRDLARLTHEATTFGMPLSVHLEQPPERSK